MSDTSPNPDPFDAASSLPRKEPLWTRALFMLLFAVIAHFLVWIFIASCILQLIVYLVSERPNDELATFMRQLLAYIGVTFAYLGFLQDEKPFPFSPFPHPLQDR
jgi:Domain of unknown function (DUF4389)